MTRTRFLTVLQRYATRYEYTRLDDLWLTPSEITALAGWRRQRTHQLLATGLIEERQLHLPNRTIKKARALHIASLLRDKR
jgi:hypothetical protein